MNGCNNLQLILQEFRDIVTRGLGRDPPTDVEPTKLCLNSSNTKAINTKPRRYSALSNVSLYVHKRLNYTNLGSLLPIPMIGGLLRPYWAQKKLPPIFG